jgi:hypothetical protein
MKVWTYRNWMRRVFGSIMLIMPMPIAGCGTHVTPMPRQLSEQRAQAARTWVGKKAFDRVLIVVFENQDYDVVKADPIFAKWASRGASFRNFYGLFHPSYPNYLAMVGGRRYPTAGDNQNTFDGRTVADLLADKGLTWKNYAEGYPGRAGHCFLGDTSGRYARKHVPFLSFRSVQEAGCENVVNADQFDVDVASGSLPTYSFYSPDLDNDGHDPVLWRRKGLDKAAKWLDKFMTYRFPEPKWGATLIVLTFDESARQGSYNHIYTVLLGNMVKSTKEVDASAPDTLDFPYNHYDVLRTVEENFMAGALPEQAAATPILGIWR